MSDETTDRTDGQIEREFARLWFAKYAAMQRIAAHEAGLAKSKGCRYMPAAVGATTPTPRAPALAPASPLDPCYILFRYKDENGRSASLPTHRIIGFGSPAPEEDSTGPTGYLSRIDFESLDGTILSIRATGEPIVDLEARYVRVMLAGLGCDETEGRP